jgi:hypothetical protein
LQAFSAVALDDQTSGAESIAAELRASIRKARVPSSPSTRRRIERSDAMSGLDGSIEHDLTLLRANYDVAHAPFTSHRPVMGRFIIFIKNLARELLVQLLERQSSYNGAVARALNHLSRKLDLVAQEQQRIVQRLDALESMVRAGAPGAGTLNQRIDAIEKAISEPARGLHERA